MESRTITVATAVPVAPERAWAIHTDPDSMTKWNVASEDWRCPSASVDLRVGGAHRARMKAKDGSFGFDFEGIYSEVDAPRSLTLVLSDGRTARTTFTPFPDGTRVETTFDADANPPLDMQRDGWQAVLNNDRTLASRSAL